MVPKDLMAYMGCVAFAEPCSGAWEAGQEALQAELMLDWMRFGMLDSHRLYTLAGAEWVLLSS